MALTHRYFDLKDDATTQNLDGLAHLAGQDCRGGDLRLFEILLHAAIHRLELLPSAVRRHFRSSAFYVGDFHHRASAPEREARWRDLALLLEEGLDAAFADPSLTRDGGADLGDRPPTRGERIDTACRALEAAWKGGGDWDGLLARLEHEAVGTPAGGDARELRRLLSRKRVPDWTAHTQKIHGLLYHARLCAQNLYHLP